MFVGTTPKEALSLIQKILPRNRENIFVGCSENFTIDRLCSSLNHAVFSNDISLYSLLIADILMKRESKVNVVDKEFKEIFDSWPDSEFKKFLQVLFVVKVSKFYDRKNDYQKEMFDVYKEKAREYYEKSVEKFKSKNIFNFTIADFDYGDFTDFLSRNIEKGICIAFPPTYAGGYEKMYNLVESVFSYRHPLYQVFDSDAADPFYKELLQGGRSIIISDVLYPTISDYLVGKIKLLNGRKLLFMYSSVEEKKVFLVEKNDKILGGSRKLLNNDYQFKESSVIDFITVSANEINYYKPFFMALKVDYSTGGEIGLMFRVDGQVFGFASFSERLSRQDPDFMFIHSDFVVSTGHKKLSKLVLYLLKSKEVQYFLSTYFKNFYQGLKTTVYTDKPVSMKYRGVFSLKERQKGRLLYFAKFTNETMQEAFKKWLKTSN